MTREVRLGLVPYGSVSLTIYMNGVAHEFFNAVRGRGLSSLPNPNKGVTYLGFSKSLASTAGLISTFFTCTDPLS